MIRYENAGSQELDTAIERLCDNSQEDLDQHPREAIIVTLRGNYLIVSYHHEMPEWWVVYAGSYSIAESNYHGRTTRGDLKDEIEKQGYKREGLRWVNLEILPDDFGIDEKPWLINRLEISPGEYDDSLWTRSLAVEYTIWATDSKFTR